MAILAVFAIIFGIPLGIRQGKLARAKLRNPDTPEKIRFMEWRSLLLKANSWFLWGWILFLPVIFVGRKWTEYLTQAPASGLGLGLIFIVLMSIPGTLFSGRAQKIRKEMGFSEKDALNRRIGFE